MFVILYVIMVGVGLHEIHSQPGALCRLNPSLSLFKGGGSVTEIDIASADARLVREQSINPGFNNVLAI